ncbi:MAG: serine hydrolase [Gammaproteobacteria bacterium]
MKRIALLSLFLIAVAMLLASFRYDTLYWKRRVLSSIYSPATLPASYYEPSETIEGSDGPSPPRVTPEDENLEPAALQAAAEYADSEHTTALIVGRHGHIVFEKYWGDSNYETMIDAGAFNATLTALMVGMTMSDRKIALPSEPVANYIESFRERNRATITLEDLLHMTSGLGPNRVTDTGTNIGTSPVARASAVFPTAASTHDQLTHDIRAECLDLERAAAPGSRWQPQACDPQLLAHIIERASGKQYSAYVSEKLWKPLGAGDALLMLDHEGGTAHAGCCLRARQGDWMRIAQLLVNDGKFEGEQILPPGWVRTMLTPSKANPRFGYQVWRGRPFEPGEDSSEPLALDDAFVLKGNGKTRLWLVPSLSLGILRVGTNDESDASWDDSRIPNLIIRGARDYRPNDPTGNGVDIKKLVPNH